MFEIQDKTLNRLFYGCALKKDERQCAQFDTTVAIIRATGHILKHLKIKVDFAEKIKVPVTGPDPSPISREDLEIILGKAFTTPDIDPAVVSVTPDTSPAINIFPTVEFSGSPVRLKAGIESATLLKEGLLKIASILENDIKEMHTRLKM